MKKTIAMIIAMIMLAVPGVAGAARVFSVDTDMGAALIDENGALITGMGDYDVIDLISYGCPPERQLFMASRLDISDGFFLEDEYGDFYGDDGWDEGLDDEEQWPDTEGLDEGYDMEIVDDMPIVSDMQAGAEEEFSDEFFDSAFEPEDIDYGVALMNAKGEVLTDFEYVGFAHDAENAVVEAYGFDGYVTMLDEAGNVLMTGEYTSAVSNGKGGFMAIAPVFDPETGDFEERAPVVRIDPDGSVTETGIYSYPYETLPGYSYGLMCVPVCGENGDYSNVFIDADGNNAFGTGFEYASSFVDGYAEVMGEDYTSRLIDVTGAYVTGDGYSYFDIGYEDDGMPIVANLQDGGFELLSKADCSVIAAFPPEADCVFYAYQCGDGTIAAYSDTQTMLVDGAGNVLYRGEGELYAQTWYEYADSVPERMIMSDFRDDAMRMCVAYLDGAPAGEWYAEVQALSWTGGEGRYLVLDYGYVEYEFDGEVFLEPDMDTFRYGVTDQDGNMVVGMKYDYFDMLASDRYWAAEGGTYSLIDDNGGVIAVFEE